MSIDKEKLDALLEEIKRLEENPSKMAKRMRYISYKTIKEPSLPTQEKKPHLLPTEKKAYFQISHYYRFTMLSIGDMGTALSIWIKGILPLLLVQHSLNLEEWERICNIGDHDPLLAKDLEADWKGFYQGIVKQGRIEPEILALLNKGKKRVNKMRKQ